MIIVCYRNIPISVPTVEAAKQYLRVATRLDKVVVNFGKAPGLLSFHVYHENGTKKLVPAYDTEICQKFINEGE